MSLSGGLSAGLVCQLSAALGGGGASRLPLADRINALIFAATGSNPTALYLPGPEYWFTDAAKTTPVVNTDPIRVWADASGNGRDLTQATTAARPQATLTGGFWRAGFDGVDDVLALASHPFGTGNPAYSLAVVVSLVSATTPYNALGFGDFGIPRGAFGLFPSANFGGGTAGRWSSGHANATNYNSTATTSTAGQRIILTRAAGTTIAAGTSLYRNGVLASDNGGSSTATPALVSGPFQIGSTPAYSAPFLAGQVVAAVAVTTNLSAGTVASLDALLAEVTP